jgi:dihydropyrimidine dehydrogenase (NAD+) subunit PreT
VGAGPAGLSCAHRAAQLGHSVTLFDARPKLGGLNEYGIAAYKTPGDFAQAEVDFVLAIGGIEVKTGTALGRDIDLATLRRDYDAVFLGLGLGGTNVIEGMRQHRNVEDAVGFIERLRQAPDKAEIPVGRRVVVIGGGMTAIDAAVQSRRLGAEEVTIAYRRGAEHMKASRWEQDLALTNGVAIRHWVSPTGFASDAGGVAAVTFEHRGPGGTGPAETLSIAADMVLVAIGQTFLDAPLGPGSLALDGGRIRVDAERRTTLPDVWAGGDCVAGGPDLTVSAVEDGKQAALSIDRALRAAPLTLAGAA